MQTVTASTSSYARGLQPERNGAPALPSEAATGPLDARSLRRLRCVLAMADDMPKPGNREIFLRGALQLELDDRTDTLRSRPEAIRSMARVLDRLQGAHQDGIGILRTALEPLLDEWGESEPARGGTPDGDSRRKAEPADSPGTYSASDSD